MSSNPWSGFMQKTQKQQLIRKSKSRTDRTRNRKRKAPDPDPKNGTPTTGPIKKKRRISKLERVTCPICNKLYLSNLINFHIEEHFLNTNSGQSGENKENIPSSQSSSTSSTVTDTMNAANTRSSSIQSIGTISTKSPQSPFEEPVDSIMSTDSTPSTQRMETEKCSKSTDQNQSDKPLKNVNPQKSETKKTAKTICPLFTMGALPASAFNKPKKRSSPPPAQEAIFYVDIKSGGDGAESTDESNQHITDWNAQWIDDKDSIKEFMTKSRESGHFMTSVLIKEPNTIGATKVHLICNIPSLDSPLNVQSKEFKFMYPTPHSIRFSPSLTKSLLQKCVRVSYADSAVKAAYLLLLKDGLQSLLRRLSIIVIEDVILMEDFILLIWVMLAESKSDPNEKYHPSLMWYNFIFSVVRRCGKYEIKDYQDYTLHPDGVAVPYISLFTPMHSNQSESLDEGIKGLLLPKEDEKGIKGLLVRCMLMRAAYGGMKCDVAMMRSYACIWHNRFFGQTEQCKYFQPRLATLVISTQIEEILMADTPEKKTEDDSVHPDRAAIQQIVDENDWLLFLRRLHILYTKESNGRVSMKQIEALKDKDLILSAVDFHCSNMLTVICDDGKSECCRVIMEYLNAGKSKVYNNGNPQWRNNVAALLKVMIWEFRSSQTDKVGLLMTEEKPLELFDLWQKVKNAVNDFSLHYMQSRRGRGRR